MLKLLDKSLKLKSTFVQGHFPGRNWIVLWMKMNEKSLKNSGKTYIIIIIIIIISEQFIAVR